jgi:hypothetical protein
MFTRSFLIEVGVVEVGAIGVMGVLVDIIGLGKGVGECLGDDAREVGTSEIAELDGVLICRAGPITCSKLKCWVR